MSSSFIDYLIQQDNLYENEDNPFLSRPSSPTMEKKIEKDNPFLTRPEQKETLKKDKNIQVPNGCYMIPQKKMIHPSQIPKGFILSSPVDHILPKTNDFVNITLKRLLRDGHIDQKGFDILAEDD
jgi:hypothetical protein